MVLIGNKNDLEKDRKVTFEEGKKFAEENKFMFEEVSAKNGNNFETLFEVKIFEAIYKKYKSEFDKREKMEYDDNANYETKEVTNNPNENKVKLEKINNNQNAKKKKKCC